MKRKCFVKTSNLHRFLAGLEILERRAAPEACFMVVTSEPGYGKTMTLHWYSTQNADAIYLRAKSGYTRHWFLAELLKELNPHGTPINRTEDMFSEVLKRMIGHNYVLIVDEAEHAVADTQVLEAIRDLADLLEAPVVLVGMESIQGRIARHPQVSSRVAAVVQFQPASTEDVSMVAQALMDGITLQEDLAKEIQKQTKGRMREVMNALAVCERVAIQRKVKTLSRTEMEGQELTYDWQARKARQMKVVQ